MSLAHGFPQSDHRFSRGAVSTQPQPSDVVIHEDDKLDCVVFSVRDASGDLLAMACLKRQSGTVGEIRRVWTSPVFRGRGFAGSILMAIIERARSSRIRELVLTTGHSEEFAPARRLYERFGFAPCEAVLDDRPDGHNRFYRKVLSA